MTAGWLDKMAGDNMTNLLDQAAAYAAAAAAPTS